MPGLSVQLLIGQDTYTAENNVDHRMCPYIYHVSNTKEGAQKNYVRDSVTFIVSTTLIISKNDAKSPFPRPKVWHITTAYHQPRSLIAVQSSPDDDDAIRSRHRPTIPYELLIDSPKWAHHWWACSFLWCIKSGLMPTNLAKDDRRFYVAISYAMVCWKRWNLRSPSSLWYFAASAELGIRLMTRLCNGSALKKDFRDGMESNKERMFHACVVRYF